MFYLQPRQESKENIRTFLASLDLPTVGDQQNKCLTSQITGKEL